MKKYSKWSFSLIVFGSLLMGINWLLTSYSDFLMFIGFISFVVAILLSFIAISKQEKGILKFLTITVFFVILFLITWFEPFQFVRMLTWMKNGF